MTNVFAGHARMVLSATLIALSMPLAAQTSKLTTISGKVVQIGYYSFLRSDCSGGVQPVVRITTEPKNGVVVIRFATLQTKRLQQCGIVKAPTAVVFYKPSANYVGTEQLGFEIMNPENGKAQQVTAEVAVVEPKTRI